MIGPIQDIEAALGSMNTLRYFPEAAGAQLDTIGAIVGVTRPPGASDLVYSQLIMGKIAQNVSDGLPEQIISLFLLFTQVNYVTLYEAHNAEYLLESVWVPTDQDAVDGLIEILQNASPAGVRCAGIVSYDGDLAFAYAGDQAGLGYDDGTQVVGGEYATLHEFKGPGFAYAGSDYSGQGYGTLFDPLAGGCYLT